MKPRTTALHVPDGDQRYWVVELSEEREYHFVFPGWARALLLVQEMQAGRSFADGAGVKLLPWWGLYMGLCWSHRGILLSTPLPSWTASADDLRAYGAAVADELYEHGLKLAEVAEVAVACEVAVLERLGYLEAAQEDADFTDGGTESAREGLLPETSPATPGALTTSPLSG